MANKFEVTSYTGPWHNASNYGYERDTMAKITKGERTQEFEAIVWTLKISKRSSFLMNQKMQTHSDVDH